MAQLLLLQFSELLEWTKTKQKRKNDKFATVMLKMKNFVFPHWKQIISV